MKKGLLTLITTSLIASSALADANLVQSLKELELKANDLTTQTQLTPSPERRDISVVLGLSQGLPPSKEGIPGSETDLDPSDLINTAYSTSTLIQKAIDEARSLPMGQKIQNYRDSVARVLSKSGQDPMEQAVRITLNRAVDVVNNIIGIAGMNPEVIAQLAANFYEQSFKMALAYANNPSFIVTTRENSVADYIHRTSIAQFGYVYSTLLWRYQSTLTSDAAKAVILVKMLGYLGWDFNMDLRRREQGLKEVIADVYFTQHENAAYHVVINALASNQEPTAAIAALRSKVYKIWSSVPQKLASAGVSVTPNEN